MQTSHKHASDRLHAHHPDADGYGIGGREFRRAPAQEATLKDFSNATLGNEMKPNTMLV